MNTSVLPGNPVPGELDSSTASSGADFGDFRAEFDALVSSCGIYELKARARIVLTGKDRVRWLNGMISNNIRDLDAGHGIYAFVLNPQGHILGDLYAYQRGDSLLLDISRSQLEKLLPILKRYIIMDDVKMNDSEEASIGVAGPKAKELLRAAGLEFSALEPLQFIDISSPAGSITIARSDNPAVESFELWLAPASAPALWAAILKAGARPVGMTALELLRVASGIPQYGQDIRERDLPQETGQDRALNFSKGCFIGQEIVERIRSRGAVHRRFTGFLVDGSLPLVGTKIQGDGKDVGEITSAASLPSGVGDLAVSLGYVRREAVAPDKQLSAHGVPLRVVDLPFRQIFVH